MTRTEELVARVRRGLADGRGTARLADGLPPADRDALLRLVDLNTWEMYREISRLSRGSLLLETPEATMVSRPHATPWHNMVMVHAPLDPDVLLATLGEFYGRDERPFSIWTRSHADGELETALRARGFTELVPMPDMVLFGDPGTRCEPPGLQIRAVRADADRRDFITVARSAYEVYGIRPELYDDTFASLGSLSAPHIQGFVGRVDGEPVAAAAVYVTHGVAGINWVGTVPAHARHRYAEAVTWAAIREGFRRGGAFASLQPTHMGRPVYERMGFVAVAEYPVLVRAA